MVWLQDSGVVRRFVKRLVNRLIDRARLLYSVRTLFLLHEVLVGPILHERVIQVELGHIFSPQLRDVLDVQMAFEEVFLGFV